MMNINIRPNLPMPSQRAVAATTAAVTSGVAAYAVGFTPANVQHAAQSFAGFLAAKSQALYTAASAYFAPVTAPSMQEQAAHAANSAFATVGSYIPSTAAMSCMVSNLATNAAAYVPNAGSVQEAAASLVANAPEAQTTAVAVAATAAAVFAAHKAHQNGLFTGAYQAAKERAANLHISDTVDAIKARYAGSAEKVVAPVVTAVAPARKKKYLV
jgi:hypothetical protein